MKRLPFVCDSLLENGVYNKRGCLVLVADGTEAWAARITEIAGQQLHKRQATESLYFQ